MLSSLSYEQKCLHPSSTTKIEGTFLLKHCTPSTKLHGVTAQKTNLYSAVKPPNPTVIFIHKKQVASVITTARSLKIYPK
jgi:hypothetical protein